MTDKIICYLCVCYIRHGGVVVIGGALLSCQACLLHLRGIKSTITHHGEQNVAAPSCQGDKRLVVSLPLAHFACVVSPGYRISERGEGEQEQRPFEAFIAPSRGMFPTYG